MNTAATTSATATYLLQLLQLLGYYRSSCYETTNSFSNYCYYSGYCRSRFIIFNWSILPSKTFTSTKNITATTTAITTGPTGLLITANSCQQQLSYTTTFVMPLLQQLSPYATNLTVATTASTTVTALQNCQATTPAIKLLIHLAITAITAVIVTLISSF